MYGLRKSRPLAKMVSNEINSVAVPNLCMYVLRSVASLALHASIITYRCPAKISTSKAQIHSRIGGMPA